MKCRKPNTDQECNITVLANGQPCAEFILPSQTDFASSAGDVLECFIPVSEDDEITLTGYFRGSVLHASFDLLADGSFVGDKRIEGLKTGELKHYSQRKLDYSTVMHVPKEQGWTSIFEPTKVVEGRLGIKALPQADAKVQRIVSAMKHNGSRISLGSVAVVVSLNQDGNDNHANDFADMRCGGWRNRDNAEATSGGIRATHELEVRFADDLINTNKQSKHRRHFEQTRFGKRPWATFVFYYRSSPAIRQAGCVARPDRWQSLIDGGENYEQVDPTPKKPQRPVVQNRSSQQQQGATSANPAVLPKLQEPLKAKLFGQSLFSQAPKPGAVRASPDTLFVPQTGEEDETGAGWLSSPRSSPSCTDSFDREDDMTHSPKETAAGSETEIRRSSSRSQIPKPSALEFQGGHVHEVRENKSNVDGENLVNIPTPSQQDIVANFPPPAAAIDGRQVPAPTQSYLRDSDGREDHAEQDKQPRQEPSHDDIRALASPEGEIPSYRLANYFAARGIEENIGLKIVAQVAYEPAFYSSWYLKNSSRVFNVDGVSLGCHPPATERGTLPEFFTRNGGKVHSESHAPVVPGMRNALGDGGVLPSIEDGDGAAQAVTPAARSLTEEIKVKTEPGSAPTPGGLQTLKDTLASTANEMAPPSTPMMETKRPTSTRSPTASREGTPSKRARSAAVELREKVAAAKMQKEKMLQRKAELQKRVKEQKARREKERLERERREEEERLAREKREEEELLRELEEMRRENEALEDELEAEEKRLEADAGEADEGLEHE